jgi:hypothetical protein
MHNYKYYFHANIFQSTMIYIKKKLVYFLFFILLLGLCLTIIGIKDKTNEKHNLQKTI